MKKPQLGTTPNHDIQTLMDLRAVTEKEVDGIGMGVLSDGTAYLTARGLARMCGIDHTKILDVANNWGTEQFRPRGTKIANLLQDQGFDSSILFHAVEIDGSTHHAFPDQVCMAFLEYYAFEAGPNKKEHALRNYRRLARLSLRLFVYESVGYNPSCSAAEAWRNFHDRVSLTYNKVPDGYFCIFKEIADMVVHLIQADVPVGEKTVPDLSVGLIWGKHWRDHNFDHEFGERVKYEHNYPDYFPQAVSNPQEPWAYPDAALPEFRRWMKSEYLPNKFPLYLEKQAVKHGLPSTLTQKVIEAVNFRRI